MEIKSDIICKGEDWYNINQKLVGKFFDTLWSAFKISLAIGILYDSQKEDVSGQDDKATVPRTKLQNNSGIMSYYFKSAILTSNCISMNEKDRLYLAFSEDVQVDELEGEDKEILKRGVSETALSFDRVGFLRKFANYGAEKLAKCIANNDTETMENLMEFLESSYRGETEELMKMKEIDENIDMMMYQSDEI